MKNKGFTLIELIAVIVVLGVLAVTAAPKFINLQTDAKNASLQGLKGAIESGLAIGYSKLALNGLQNAHHITSPDGNRPTDIPIQGCENRCSFRYGYPESDWYTITALVSGINRDFRQVEDWGITKLDGSNALIITDRSNLRYPGTRPTLVNNNCFLRYTDATASRSTYNLELVACE